MAPIRVGIIGVGWGSIVQTPAFRAVPEFEVAALCSRQPERVEAAGEQLGIDDTSTDWREFVRRDDLDLISVCTPVKLHAEQTIAAVEAGKHVLCEKPVAVDATDAQRMLDAAEARRCRARGVLREPVRPRAAGRARCRSGRCARRRRTSPRAHTSADYWHPTRGLQSEWMYRLDEGGGYLMGMSSHDIDFVLRHVRRARVGVRRRPVHGSRAPGRRRQAVRRRRRRHVGGDHAHAVGDGRARSAVRRWHSARVNESSSCSAATAGSSSRAACSVATSKCAATRVGDESPSTVPLNTRMPRSGAELPKRRAAGAIRSLAVMLEDWLPGLLG